MQKKSTLPETSGKIKRTFVTRVIQEVSDLLLRKSFWIKILLPLVEKAVKGMLPKNNLGAELFRNLNVYVGTEHNQEAQKPKAINLNDLK